MSGEPASDTVAVSVCAEGVSGRRVSGEPAPRAVGAAGGSLRRPAPSLSRQPPAGGGRPLRRGRAPRRGRLCPRRAGVPGRLVLGFVSPPETTPQMGLVTPKME